VAHGFAKKLLLRREPCAHVQKPFWEKREIKKGNNVAAVTLALFPAVRLKLLKTAALRTQTPMRMLHKPGQAKMRDVSPASATDTLGYQPENVRNLGDWLPKYDILQTRQDRRDAHSVSKTISTCSTSRNVGFAYRSRPDFAEFQRESCWHRACEESSNASLPLMSEWFSSHLDVLRWCFILLSIGIMDALIQFADYLHCRKEGNESTDVRD
jgi:hypothetical protein